MTSSSLLFLFSKRLSSITRGNIRQWFCKNEIPKGAFCSPNGQIYPWFHGIIF
jgi:hypothetical protein